MGRRRWIVIAVGAVALALALGVGRALLRPCVALADGSGAELCLPNLHAVEPGRLYRSAQLDADELARAIDALGIRTVVNLRGARDRPWYESESAVAREKGVVLVDARFSPGEIPHRDSLLRVLDAYENAERPLLVHCRAGADRAGLASALWNVEQMKQSRDDARASLSWRFWHVAMLHPEIHYFLDVYRGRDWARSDYHPCRGGFRFYDSADERYCPPPRGDGASGLQ